VRSIIETELWQAVELQSKHFDQKGRTVLTDNVEHMKTSSGSIYQLGQVRHVYVLIYGQYLFI
jgi:hypothetical protein